MIQPEVWLKAPVDSTWLPIGPANLARLNRPECYRVAWIQSGNDFSTRLNGEPGTMEWNDDNQSA
ncbi:MAG: hypothetical protein A3H91_00230 [Gammaproteobacteria bacterium RIFCSPLOWO2_02_FULL_61_13]|nr:MAG: hypothetical protein A3H91_00230 [Gammaproteobacteria bacterium RIFCSPLOWO2_02_FULL_61_13]